MGASKKGEEIRGNKSRSYKRLSIDQHPGNSISLVSRKYGVQFSGGSSQHTKKPLHCIYQQIQNALDRILLNKILAQELSEN